MNIRTKLTLSFTTLVISLALAGFIGILGTELVHENHETIENISSVRSIQRDMQETIAEILTITDLQQLETLKSQFIKQLQFFHPDLGDTPSEAELNALPHNDYTALRGTFSTIASENPEFISDIIASQRAMESIGVTMFQIHAKKLQQNQIFLEKYPLENRQRKVIREVIFALNDPTLLKEIGALQYYSKETLYQHRDQKHLSQWQSAIHEVEEYLLDEGLEMAPKTRKMVIEELGRYSETAQIMGKIAISAREIETEEAQQIIEFRKRLQANKKISDLAKERRLQASEDLKNNVMLVQIFLIALMVVCAFFLSTYISRSVSTAITQLKSGVETIKEGKLGVAITVNEKNEFQELANAFNDMSYELKQTKDSLEASHQNLEKTVQQRTRKLNDTLQTMEELASKLSKYLSPQVYDSIFTGAKEVKIETNRKKLTVFFSDIKDFTETTDNLESEALTSLLNHYLDEMSKIALKHGGTIDKFIGDAILIFFGDPMTKGEKEDAKACVRMALEMRERMQELREVWAGQGFSKPLQIRIGVNTGYCTVGNFGSENRLDYTIIGGQVNLASRLESNAEPNQILLSHETYALVNDEILCKKREEIKVKGIAYPIQTFQAIDLIQSMNQKSETIQEAFEGFTLSVNFKQTNKEKALHSLKKAIQQLQ